MRINSLLLPHEGVTVAAGAPEDATLKKKLFRIRGELDALLEKYNPGERLTWWVSDDAFAIPKRTTDALKRCGPALADFFRVANRLFYENEWIQLRLEKRFTPHYGILNRSQVDALPRLIRPDVVCDADWNPKLVELEITVGSRGSTAVMARQYGLDPQKSLIRSYAALAKALEREGKNLALVTISHPYFPELPDDAREFASMLREEGVGNLTILTEENIDALRFDGEHLVLNERYAESKVLHAIDRQIDIYEIAELQHPGMAAMFDALVADRVTDINTCKQFLDEKDWMSLFWEPRLRDTWKQRLGEEHDRILRALIPKTWILQPHLTVPMPGGEEIPIQEIGNLEPEFRRFVVKESGTSTTASGAQSFRVLHQMEPLEIKELFNGIFRRNVEHVIQELIESPRIAFTAIDPKTSEIISQREARVKLSPFFIDGKLTDIRLVASNKKYAVNDEDYVTGVVRY